MLALDLTEKGFTAEEAISKVNKLEKRVIEDLKTEKDLNDLTVKPKTKNFCASGMMTMMSKRSGRAQPWVPPWE